MSLKIYYCFYNKIDRLCKYCSVILIQELLWNLEKKYFELHFIYFLSSCSQEKQNLKPECMCTYCIFSKQLYFNNALRNWYPEDSAQNLKNDEYPQWWKFLTY